MRDLKTQGTRVHSVVTDPPYHFASIVSRFGKEGSAPTIDQGVFKRSSTGFMGKEWDGGDIAFNPETWRLAYDLLLPGGHLLAFAATKNYHRMACAIEDAGFEIRDQIGWLYGTGFPKSHSIGKQIDKNAGAERKSVGGYMHTGSRSSGIMGSDKGHVWHDVTEPTTKEARQWEGWGTALKPAWEPICVARKPIEEKSIAANVLEYGTGGINIDDCRVPSDGRPLRILDAKQTNNHTYSGRVDGSKGFEGGSKAVGETTLGRHPANVIHDGSQEIIDAFPSAEKSPARFFYSAKASKKDRVEGSTHPTVKPIALMRYLTRLVTPVGGTVLDPFSGTGTTLQAAYEEGFDSIGIERENEYVKDIEKRMSIVTDRGVLDV